MRKIENHILTLVLFCTAFFSLSNKTLAQTGNSYPFMGGENMDLIIHYKWGLSADIATVKFTFKEVQKEDSEPYYHLYATGKTSKFFDGLFKVRDKYESKFFIKDLSPLYFHRDIEEGGYTAKNYYTWSENGMKLRAKVEKKGRQPIDTTFAIGSQIRDIINLFYVLRAHDFKRLESGESVYYTVAIDRNIIDVAVRFDKRETKKIGDLGTFKTIKLAVKMKQRKNDASPDDNSRFSINSSMANEKEKMFIWFSDDQNKLPLYFSSPVSVGSINGRISRYDGIKYPVTSLISD